MVSSDPRFLVNQIHRWETWSDNVGLFESSSKTQLTATSRACRDRLALVATDPAKVQFEILGCCAQVSRRTESAKESQRLWQLLPRPCS